MAQQTTQQSAATASSLVEKLSLRTRRKETRIITVLRYLGGHRAPAEVTPVERIRDRLLLLQRLGITSNLAHGYDSNSTDWCRVSTKARNR